jgi:hypothetical protein
VTCHLCALNPVWRVGLAPPRLAMLCCNRHLLATVKTGVDEWKTETVDVTRLTRIELIAR